MKKAHAGECWVGVVQRSPVNERLSSPPRQQDGLIGAGTHGRPIKRGPWVLVSVIDGLMNDFSCSRVQATGWGCGLQRVSHPVEGGALPTGTMRPVGPVLFFGAQLATSCSNVKKIDALLGVYQPLYRAGDTSGSPWGALMHERTVRGGSNPPGAATNVTELR